MFPFDVRNPTWFNISSRERNIMGWKAEGRKGLFPACDAVADEIPLGIVIIGSFIHRDVVGDAQRIVFHTAYGTSENAESFYCFLIKRMGTLRPSTHLASNSFYLLLTPSNSLLSFISTE